MAEDVYQQQSTDESWEKSDDDGSAEVMKFNEKDATELFPPEHSATAQPRVGATCNCTL